MIIFQESSLFSLSGDEVLAIAASINGGLPTVGNARSFLLGELGEKLTVCENFIPEMLEEGLITPQEAEEGRPTNAAEVELLEATIEKVEALSEIDCTYLLGLVTGFMAGTGERPLGEQWNYGRLAATAATL